MKLCQTVEIIMHSIAPAVAPETLVDLVVDVA